MRLIDAEELDKKLFSEGFFGGLSGALNGYKTRRKFTIGEIRTMLKNVPTIELPKKRGKWITVRTMIHDGEPYCSECGIEPYKKSNIDMPNFCPNCGADMRTEGKQNE